MAKQAREVLLTGSVPLRGAENVFECVAEHLGPLAPRIPDGEQIGWSGAARRTFEAHPMLEKYKKVPLNAGGKDPVDIFRLKAGCDVKDLKLGPYGYAENHAASYAKFTALRDKGTKNLTLVCNSMGAPGELRGQILAENKQVKKLIAAFTVRPGMPTATEDQIVSGELEVELVPQGTLVERCRAGGAGIPAFYSATVAGTDLEKGKEIREFDGRRYVLEPAIKLDYALLRAHRADRAGNVQFRGGSQNLNPAFAKAARCAIVEVDEIVEVGGIPPELINLPGIFVSRVVKSTYPFDPKQTPQSNRRPADKPREYNGKPALTRAGIAKRAAAIVREGSYVNLGTQQAADQNNSYRQ